MRRNLSLGIGIGVGSSRAPSSPSAILGSALVLDLDSRFATFAGSSLTAAQDQAGSHNDGTATSVTYSPNGGVKGLPKFTFGASSTIAGANNIVTTGAARTIIAVISPTSVGGAVFTSRQAIASNCCEYRSFGGNLLFMSDEVSQNDTVPLANYSNALHCVIWKWQTGAGLPVLIVDGVTPTVTGPNTANESGSAGYRVGTTGSGTAAMTGDGYRWLAVNRFTTSQEDASLRAYMQYLYGTP